VAVAPLASVTVSVYVSTPVAHTTGFAALASDNPRLGDHEYV
jgi:hypothetical protein